MSERPPRGLGTMNPEMNAADGYYDWLAALLGPHAGRRILEIGPGYGSLAARLGRGAEFYAGIDDSDEVVRHLEGRFPDRGRWLFRRDARLGADNEAELARARPDTVLAVNLLEHLPDERAALDCWARIAPGARLLIVVPALPALYGTLDEQAGHYRRYTRGSLRAALERAGAGVERLRYFNAVGALGWFVSGRVLRQDLGGEGTARSVRIYERYVLPLARLADPLLRPFWGQSVLAVGRLPGGSR